MFATLSSSAMTIRRVQSRGMFDRLAETLRLGLAAHHQRQSLRGLDAALLADIGLTAKAAEAEANRPFWDVPSTWRR